MTIDRFTTALNVDAESATAKSRQDEGGKKSTTEEALTESVLMEH